MKKEFIKQNSKEINSSFYLKTNIEEHHKSHIKHKDIKEYLNMLRFINSLVGMTGLEPAATSSQNWRDTKLHHIPICVSLIPFLKIRETI